MISGKVWGSTVAVEMNPFAEMHHARFSAGKRCSRHVHRFKWNGFYVLSGKLLVRVWQPSGLVDETILIAGQYTKVAPGIPHRFEGIEDGEVIELYWPELDHSDIVRDDCGGDL